MTDKSPDDEPSAEARAAYNRAMKGGTASWSKFMAEQAIDSIIPQIERALLREFDTFAAQRNALLAALRATRDHLGEDLDEMVDTLIVPSAQHRSYPERRALIPDDDLGLPFVIELERLIEQADAAIAKVTP